MSSVSGERPSLLKSMESHGVAPGVEVCCKPDVGAGQATDVPAAIRSEQWVAAARTCQDIRRPCCHREVVGSGREESVLAREHEVSVIRRARGCPFAVLRPGIDAPNDIVGRKFTIAI